MSTAEAFAHAYAEMRGLTLREAVEEITYRLVHEKRENAPGERDAEKLSMEKW